MKKAVCLLTALLLIVCLSGCNPTHPYTCKELTMKVPSNMADVSELTENSTFTFALESDTLFICGIREDIHWIAEGPNMTAEDYAHILIEQYQMEDYAYHDERHGYVYINFAMPLEDGVHQYLCGVYRTEEAFWLIQIDARTEDFSEKDWFSYLDSVKFS